MLLHQRLVVVNQPAQLAKGLRRDEARFEQVRSVQIGNPFHVFHIRLTARNHLQVRAIGSVVYLPSNVGRGYLSNAGRPTRLMHA